MPLFWFLSGILCTLAALIILLPLLRKIPRLSSLPVLPWQAPLSALLVVAAIFGSHHWIGAATPVAAPAAAPAVAVNAAKATGGFAEAARVSANLTPPAPPAAAGSMGSAIASLQARLAKGGGSADDWELLAKSYEFLGRPADASKARARQLGASPVDANAVAAPAAGSAVAVSGEVTLAKSLSAKAIAGATLFIIAKSVDSPGIPVAVFRGRVDKWPVKFRLDDSQAMLPGRNLSSAGRVTIEARISQSGQPLAAAGDLQGSTGVINPGDKQALAITIDRIIT